MVTIGITVHNEQASLPKLYESIRNQRHFEFFELIFILSGCTDQTEQLVKYYADQDSRIKYVIEDGRKGKASAINVFLKEARTDVLVLSSADLVLDNNCLAVLTAAFKEKRIGMAGGRMYPVKNCNSPMYLMNRVLWDLHHGLCVSKPKLGELVAFRNLIKEIPCDCAVDEAYIEWMIKKEGFELSYQADAFIYNRCPLRLKDFFIQRRRVFWGHLDLKKRYDYSPASMNFISLISVSLKYVAKNPSMIPIFVILSIVECFARIHATWLFYHSHDRLPFIWPKYAK